MLIVHYTFRIITFCAGIICINILRINILRISFCDAFIICADGDIDLAVNETVWGRLYNTGQVCCASKRFLIHNSRKEEFINRMVEKIKSMKQGDPSLPTTQIGCLINERATLA